MKLQPEGLFSKNLEDCLAIYRYPLFCNESHENISLTPVLRHGAFFLTRNKVRFLDLSEYHIDFPWGANHPLDLKATSHTQTLNSHFEGYTICEAQHSCDCIDDKFIFGDTPFFFSIQEGVSEIQIENFHGMKFHLSQNNKGRPIADHKLLAHIQTRLHYYNRLQIFNRPTGFFEKFRQFLDFQFKKDANVYTSGLSITIPKIEHRELAKALLNQGIYINEESGQPNHLFFPLAMSFQDAELACKKIKEALCSF
ncbi:MAG: hypothetical protein H6621_07310 [Halobacteriovoraceae bacterium]|nr:hypothetical protein [Halobacteriovoraceae bacterium]